MSDDAPVIPRQADDKAAYMREWRKQRPHYRIAIQAYDRAMRRLVEAHPAEFDGYLAIERVVLGLPAIPDKSANNKGKPKRPLVRAQPQQFDGDDDAS
jgi:hypothetical protein